MIIQAITAEDIVKTMGDAPFYLDAETDGDGTLTYESKNPDIVKVDGTGKATIVSAGTAKNTGIICISLSTKRMRTVL